MTSFKRLATTSWLLLLLASAAGAQLRSVDLGDQFPRVERELERTREVLDRVGPMVAESNVPRAKELFGMAVTQQTRSRVIFERAQENMDRPLLAGQMLRESLNLTLQARELAQRAGGMLREQVGFEERAQRMIEQLERRIERERERDHSDDTRSAALLAEATQQLDGARRHFADHNFEVAFRIAESAMRLLNGMPGGEGPNAAGGERFRRELHRTEQLLDRARERSAELDATEKRLIEQAANLLEEAKAAAQARDGRRAHRQLEEAQRILRQLLDRTNVEATDVNRALERFDAALARLREEQQPLSSEVEQLLERALAERNQAQSAFDGGDNDRALTRLRGAMDLLDRARRLARAN
jgi:DNA repair exonuclease SbcCD ATPase subunit